MKKVKFETDFGDSEMLSYNSEGEDMVVFILSWKARILKFQFIECITFIERVNWLISDVVEIENSDLLYETVKSYYIDVPEDHPFKHYQFVDHKDPSLEVIASGVIISWPPEDDIPKHIKNVDRIIPNDLQNNGK